MALFRDAEGLGDNASRIASLRQSMRLGEMEGALRFWQMDETWAILEAGLPPPLQAPTPANN